MTTERNAQGVDGLFRELLDENRASNKLSLTPKGRRINEARAAMAELVESARAIKPAECPCKDCARLAAALAKFPEPRP